MTDTINELCASCKQDCKQGGSIKIVHCPVYKKKEVEKLKLSTKSTRLQNYTRPESIPYPSRRPRIGTGGIIAGGSTDPARPKSTAGPSRRSCRRLR